MVRTWYALHPHLVASWPDMQSKSFPGQIWA